MIKRPKSDFWTVGVVPERLERLSPERLKALRDDIVWMPPAGDWCYYADPFALRDGDELHVFVENFDYRTKRADLQRLTLNLTDTTWSAPQPVLRQPFHLSYPFVFEHEGQVWMVPETSQAEEVALYRAIDGTFEGATGDATDGAIDGAAHGSRRWERWERVAALLPGVRAVDASLLRHEGRWWMFYAVIGPDKRDQRELHVAYADELLGPWTPHARNPVRSAHDGARPAGTPFVDDAGRVTLPVQDSSAGYGSATRWVRFDRLTPDEARVSALPETFTGDLAHPGFISGLHTMSACGDVTLIDVKRIDRSRHRQWLDWRRRVRRWFGRG